MARQLFRKTISVAVSAGGLAVGVPDGTTVPAETHPVLVLADGAGAPVAPSGTAAIRYLHGSTRLEMSVNGGAWTELGGGGGTPTSRQVIAGAGLQGGGDLTADRTFNVVAGDSTIVVNADDIVVGVIGSGNLGANIVTNAKLRQSAATSVIGRSANSTGDVADIAASADGQFLVRRSAALTWGEIVDADIPATLVRTSRTISAGAGLTGGGDLTADRTISMPNVGPGGTIGSSGVASITLDAQGRVTAATAATYALASAISISAGQVAFGASSDTITGTNDFVYATNRLTLRKLEPPGTTDGTAELLRLRHNTTDPASADLATSITWYLTNDDPTEYEAARLVVNQIENDAGSEQASFDFWLRGGGSVLQRAVLSHTGFNHTGNVTAGSSVVATANVTAGANVVAGGFAQAPTVQGGTGTAGTLTLSSTSSGTKGKILFGSAGAFDEANQRLGIRTTSPDVDLNIGANIGNGGGVHRCLSIGGTTSTFAGFIVGQSSTNNLLALWRSNATPGTATAEISTFGYANPLLIDASSVQIQGANTSGRVVIGGTSADGHKLHVVGNVWASGNNNGAPGGSGIGIKYVSNVGYLEAATWGSTYRGISIDSSLLTVRIGTSTPSEVARWTGNGNLLLGGTADVSGLRMQVHGTDKAAKLTVSGLNKDIVTIIQRDDSGSYGNGYIAFGGSEVDGDLETIAARMGLNAGWNGGEGSPYIETNEFQFRTNFAWYFIDTAAATGGTALLKIHSNPSEAAPLLDILGKAKSNGFSMPLIKVTGPAHTAVFASYEAPDIVFALNRTVQRAGGGTATLAPAIKIQAPTYSAASAGNITSAATIYIDNAPAAGANMTIAASYAIFVDAGMCRFDGNGTHVFELPADATGNTTAATGRIPIRVGGSTKYLRYFDN